jgi:adenosylcobinamide hydrolase
MTIGAGEVGGPLFVSSRTREISPVRGAAGPVLYWEFSSRLRSISSAIVGGGFASPNWVLNMTVDPNYSRFDPDAHIAEVAQILNLEGTGIGLLTAVDVRTHTNHDCEGASVCATVGVRRSTWAHDPTEPLPKSIPLGANTAMPPGTINLICYVHERLSDAALVNTIVTITEAKTQALADRHIAGTGTASDTVTVLCPEHVVHQEEVFGGPRSYWGARLATSTYEAVTAGIDRQRQ